MIHHVPYKTLGHFQLDWLDSRFHFFFSGVPAPMGHGFGPLRVWNDDLIRAGTGFDMHGHRDMEIITYVRRGAISHRDSLGNSGRTEAGDVQVMSAGTGIMHAEFNLEPEDTELFQIWVEPNRQGLKPRWETARFPKGDRAGQLVALASGQADVADALTIHQDATLYGASLPAGAELVHVLKPGRRAYLVPSAGSLTVNGVKVGTREGFAAADVPELKIATAEPAELLLFDLP
jgi:redox-sensitive bicupin YhaK (pirin superfamily)